jgi:hypothetical protein
VRRFELRTGETRWRTWDLHTHSNGDTEVRSLFLRSDEVDRVVLDNECALMTLMGRSQYLSPESMGHQIIQYVRHELPQTCTLVEWRGSDKEEKPC